MGAHLETSMEHTIVKAPNSSDSNGGENWNTVCVTNYEAVYADTCL